LLFAWPALMALTLESFVLNAHWAFWNAWLPLYALAVGIGLSDVGLMRTVFGVFNAIGRPAGGGLVNRLGARRLATGGLAVQCGLLMLLPALPWVAPLLAVFGLIGILRALGIVANTVGTVESSDALGLGRAARSKRSETLTPRTRTADKVVQSICPYCAVGCGQKVYVKDEKVVQIEGDPDSPISRGRLCPKGAASEQLVNSPLRETKVKYRRPYATAWEELDLETAMDMIADRVVATREATWEHVDADGRPLNRTRGIAFLGGATLDTEENYLIKKLFTALGAIQIENQARI